LRQSRVRLPDRTTATGDQALRRPEITLQGLIDSAQVALDPTLQQESLELACLETTLKFAGYLKRQEQSVARARKTDERTIPPAFRYAGVPGLSAELVQRFEQVRPATLGQALRIPGATPAAIAVVSAYVQRFHEHA
jgi:tRNA uridine 5-carboxymethylaminomethyl modification enzyme